MPPYMSRIREDASGLHSGEFQDEEVPSNSTDSILESRKEKSVYILSIEGPIEGQEFELVIPHPDYYKYAPELQPEHDFFLRETLFLAQKNEALYTSGDLPPEQDPGSLSYELPEVLNANSDRKNFKFTDLIPCSCILKILSLIMLSYFKKSKNEKPELESPYAKTPAVQQPTGIFGVPLRQSITYANVAISLVDGEGRSYIYGYVPIVVAKCGVFLKEKGTYFRFRHVQTRPRVYC